MKNSSRLFPLLVMSSVFLLVAESLMASGGQDFPKANLAFFEEHNWEFDSLGPSDVSDESLFREHIRYYLIDLPPDEAWKVYAEADPRDQWNGPISRFSALYDPEEKELYSRSADGHLSIQENQIVFLDLYIEYLLHIAVGFRVTEFDSEAKSIAFTYLEENASHGKQEVSFHPVDYKGKSSTLIRHRSIFRSGSDFRDAAFYEPYHEQCIDELHYRVAKLNAHRISIESPREMKKKGLIPPEPPL